MGGVIVYDSYKTIHMCDFCKYRPETCNAKRAVSHILIYVPGKAAYFRNLKMECRENVMVCDGYTKK